jgi:hypothetical protein
MKKIEYKTFKLISLYNFMKTFIFQGHIYWHNIFENLLLSILLIYVKIKNTFQGKKFLNIDMHQLIHE